MTVIRKSPRSRGWRCMCSLKLRTAVPVYFQGTPLWRSWISHLLRRAWHSICLERRTFLGTVCTCSGIHWKASTNLFKMMRNKSSIKNVQLVQLKLGKNQWQIIYLGQITPQESKKVAGLSGWEAASFWKSYCGRLFSGDPATQLPGDVPAIPGRDFSRRIL